MMNSSELEEKLKHMTALLEQTLSNSVVLYKRTAALAHMIEQLAQHHYPQMTYAMRAEIDVTLHKDDVEALHMHDPEEFKKRYGETIFEHVKKEGIDTICRFGELSQHQTPQKRALQ